MRLTLSGYPPEDVRGFIEHKGQGLQVCGLLEGLRRSDPIPAAL